MKNYKFFVLIFVCALTALFTACGKTETPEISNVTEILDDAPAQEPQEQTEPAAVPAESAEAVEAAAVAEWLSPMLSISVSADRAVVFGGELPVEISNTDFGRENRGKLVTALPEEGADFETAELAQLTAEELIANGAVKFTANFAYEGGDEFNVRFRFRVDEFEGHSITHYGLGAGAGVMIFWEDADGVWWNIRRVGLGGQFTGGELTPGFFYPAGHELAGTPYPTYTFAINKDTSSDFASVDFYIIVLEEPGGDHDHSHSHGHSHDHSHDDDEETLAGYVITYQAELPDHDGHFHNFAVLSSATTYIIVEHEE